MMGRADMVEPNRGQALTEAQLERVPSTVPAINRLMATILTVAAVVIAVGAPVLTVLKIRSFFDMVFFQLIAVCALMAALILRNVHNAVRDRVLAVYALFVFVVIFWAGFEQAGNVLNIWADQSTNRYLWTDPSPPPLKEGMQEPHAEGWFAALFNPVPTAWFQSINALAIFLLAPLFAWMWTALDRRGYNPSIPFKMGMGVLFLAGSFALMIGAARSENQKSTLSLSRLPATVPLDSQGRLRKTDEDNKPTNDLFFAGRISYDAAAKQLVLHGALPIVERDRMLAQTAPAEFVKDIQKLAKDSEKASTDKPVEIKLSKVPDGFDWRFTGFAPPEGTQGKAENEPITFDPKSGTIRTTRELTDKDLLMLKVAGADSQFRDALNQLVIQSSEFRVTSAWLFWAYILATLGELCLSPVGLSMVSKLAPAKYATMLMGLWMLTSTFGQFLGGELGERYGEEWTPTEYFVIFFIGTLIASALLFVVVKLIEKMMHGVK
jgi:POT family proton-dependent oligopeptide transporter